MNRLSPIFRRGVLVVMLAMLSTARAFADARHEPITPIPPPVVTYPLRVALSERLFRDSRLSREGRRSCFSCHDVTSNGAGVGRSDGAWGRSDRLNTPTIFNASLNFRMNWEGNLRSVDSLIEQTLFDSWHMGTSPPQLTASLSRDPAIAGASRTAFHRPLDAPGVVEALSRYVDTMRTPDPPFDAWLRGDRRAMTVQQLRGYRRFKALGCVACHQGVNVGGNMYQRLGIFHPLASARPVVLRVPSLRNVATTPPYFHDGSAPTLRDAVRSMGLAQLGLALSRAEVDDLVAFLGTLTGRYRGAPLSPRRR